MIKIIAIILFLIGYLVISLESLVRVNKTAISLVLGILLWVFIMLFQPHQATVFLRETGGDIFALIIYLLSAMTLVEIITHYGFFDFVYTNLFQRHLTSKQLFYLIAFLSFLFSAFIDNLTTTIVFITIAKHFFKGHNLVRISSAIVIASNAGGVFSPIGDVTTTMLWFAGKFTAVSIVTQAVIPSLVAFFVSTIFLANSITKEVSKDVNMMKNISRREWMIIILSFLSFFLPLVMTSLQLPAYMGLLLGIGIVWLVTDITKPSHPSSSLDISIEHFFQRTDIASLNFFIGILITVSALKYLGILNDFAHIIFTQTPSDLRIILGAFAIGGLSAVFDNIPLTAAVSDMIRTTNQNLWVFIAYTVGFGGSLLSIGSGPGIIAMSMVKDLTFVKYLKIATIPVFIAFCLGAIVWYLQYLLF